MGISYTEGLGILEGVLNLTTQYGPAAHDPVSHPSYYTSHPSGVECITIAEHMTFCIGNAIKYLWRAGLKDGQPSLQDLQKARWYIDREILRLLPQGMPVAPDPADLVDGLRGTVRHGDEPGTFIGSVHAR